MREYWISVYSGSGAVRQWFGPLTTSRRTCEIVESRWLNRPLYRIRGKLKEAA